MGHSAGIGKSQSCLCGVGGQRTGADVLPIRTTQQRVYLHLVKVDAADTRRISMVAMAA